MVTRNKKQLFVVSHCQRTLTMGGSIIVQLVYSLNGLNSDALVHASINIFSWLINFKSVELETGCTVILSPMLSILYPSCLDGRMSNVLKTKKTETLANQIASFGTDLDRKKPLEGHTKWVKRLTITRKRSSFQIKIIYQIVPT